MITPKGGDGDGDGDGAGVGGAVVVVLGCCCCLCFCFWLFHFCLSRICSSSYPPCRDSIQSLIFPSYKPSQTGDSRPSKEPLIHCVEHAAATRRRSRCGAPTLFQAAPALPPQSAPSRLTPRKPRNATHQPPKRHDGQARHAECVVLF